VDVLMLVLVLVLVLVNVPENVGIFTPGTFTFTWGFASLSDVVSTIARPREGTEEHMDKAALWERFKARLIHDAVSGFSLDTSRLGYDDEYLARMEPQMRRAFDAMKALEAGAIANPDENRMVGHYWLRNPELAPTKEITAEIGETIAAIKRFAADVHSGVIAPRSGVKFSHVLVVGIGGSALGPQFVNQALNSANDPMTVSFFDNTDPDGIAKVLY
jgi:glucose-6-phosphate isomerase